MREILGSIDEDSVQVLINTFQCHRNPDVESFLRILAIPYEKSARARTYMLIENDPGCKFPIITGYFTIALHIMTVSSDMISKNKMRRLVGMYCDPEAKEIKVPCFLLGQIGKNDGIVELLNGDELMQIALQAIRDTHRLVGGRFVKVDCIDNEGLVRFYESHGFSMVQHDLVNGMNEMVCFL